MNHFFEYQHYRKKKYLKNIYFLRGDIKFEIFDYLPRFYFQKGSRFEKSWNFLVFYDKTHQIKDLIVKNKGIETTIYNQKKMKFESGNILAFPEIPFSYKYSRKKEPFNYHPKPFYIEFQYDINRKMRAILVDWLIDVHSKFKLVPTTLYLTINSVDRFLSIQTLLRQKLQLLGISSMLLASKYEEIYAPETRDFVYISDNAYSKEDIFNMEILICTTLEYNFHVPSPIFFIADWSKILNASQEEIIFSIYTLELHLVEYESLLFHSDLISICALLISISLLNNLNKDLNIIEIFEKIVRNLTTFQNLKNCSSLSNGLLILNQNSRRKLTSLKRKYNNKKYKDISDITFSVFFILK